MKSTDLAFFTTVAAVIPTFLIAYVIGVKKTMETLAEGHTDSTRRYVQSVRDMFEKKDRGLRRIVAGIASMMWASVLQILSLCLFGLAVILPAAGEYAALHSLYVGHASSEAKSTSLVGALVAGAIVVAPLAFAAFKAYNPFGPAIGVFGVLNEQRKAVKQGPRRGA